MVQLHDVAETKPLRSVADVMKPTTEPTSKDAEIIATVHDLAAEFAALLPERRPAFLGEVRTLTTGFDRFRATVFTPLDHPAFRPLMAMLDGLIATDERAIRTDRGIFDRSELATAAASISPTKVSLPVAIRNGQAVFPSHTGPDVTTFRVVRPDEVRRPASMWGDDDE